MSSRAETVLAALRSGGAAFVTDLARETGLEPSRVRASLGELLRRGLVTNDRFDPLRQGADVMEEDLLEASAPSTTRRGTGRRMKRPSLRRRSGVRPEGRWSALPGVADGGDDEARAIAWAGVLLERYGVLTRETAALDPWAPTWQDLSRCLAQAELRGEVRRGYFVEGLSGIQYATPEAAEALARAGGDGGRGGAAVLVSTLDPANLYGSGAPLDVDLLEGGTARLPRNAANFLVQKQGRPVLIVEAYGKRLTGLASASEEEIRESFALLQSLAKPPRAALKVQAYNGTAAASSQAAVLLESVGFVRDHPGMAYYGGW
jgi:ATP-dependent Lhr-like helicase